MTRLDLLGIVLFILVMAGAFWVAETMRKEGANSVWNATSTK